MNILTDAQIAQASGLPDGSRGQDAPCRSQALSSTDERG
jgi:hypothetical protein